MTSFKEFNDVVDRLVLPVNGKDYPIPLVTIEGRARWEQVQAGEGEPLTNDEFMGIWLGDVVQQMRADNVPDMSLDRAAGTAMTYNLVGKDAAEIFWETGGHPKAVEKYVKAHLPNRAARRATNTAAATTTPSRKRGSGTSTPQK